MKDRTDTTKNCHQWICSFRCEASCWMRNTFLCLELSHCWNIFLSTQSYSHGQGLSGDLEQNWEREGGGEVICHSLLRPRKIRDINDPLPIICIMHYAKWFTLGWMKALGWDSCSDWVSVSVLLFKSD